MKGCMNCGNISCGNNKKRESAGCGRWISPEDKIAELENKLLVESTKFDDIKEEYKQTENEFAEMGFEYHMAKELLKQWLQTSQNNSCDNVGLVAETEKFLKE